MKKFILLSMLTAVCIASMAQSEKYVKVMEGYISQLDTTRSATNLVQLSNSFERVALAEKNQWLPYYYAALAKVNSGMVMVQDQSGGMAAQVDPIADKAEALINEAENLGKENSEIYVVKKMIATLRMLADPMSRFMQFGQQAAEALEKAKRLNPNNPRVYVLEGQDKFFTPEQFGGNKEEAKKLFKMADEKFASYKPESNLSPSWGKAMNDYFLAQTSN